MGQRGMGLGRGAQRWGRGAWDWVLGHSGGAWDWVEGHSGGAEGMGVG